MSIHHSQQKNTILILTYFAYVHRTKTLPDFFGKYQEKNIEFDHINDQKRADSYKWNASLR